MKKIVNNVINADMLVRETDGNGQMPNPVIDYRTMEEAAGAAGFALDVSETVGGYKRELISVISNDLIQVIYQSGENSLYIRKAAGNGDISGNYTRYAENRTVKIGEVKVCMRGMDGKVGTAIWTEGGFAYSVHAASSITQEEMSNIIMSVMQ